LPPLRHRPPRRLLSATLAVALLQLPGAARAQAADELADLVLGIVHYTRWPAAPESITLCVDDTDAGAAGLAAALGALAPAPPIRIAPRHVAPARAAELFDCHALLFPDMPAAPRQELLLKLNKRPILTLGRGEGFCSHAGQICLIDSPRGLRFRANLDAIAFSGLRLNPRMLELGVREGRER